MQPPPNESSDPQPENWQPLHPPSQPLPPLYSQPPPNTYYPSQPPYQQPIQPPLYPQPGQYQPIMQPLPLKKSNRGWIIAGILIGTLFLCGVFSILCGVIANGLPKSATTVTTTTVSTVQQTQTSDTPQPTDTQQPTPTADTHPHFSGDGTFEVGKDIEPGTYRTQVASPDCYYARLSGFGGTLDQIIANERTNAPAIITIAATDKGFQSTGCGTWTKE